MSYLIRKSPGKEQQQVIFQSSLTLLPPQAGRAGAVVLQGGCWVCGPCEQGAVSAVLGSGDEPRAQSSEPSSVCLCPHSPAAAAVALCARSCAHTPCLSPDPACASTATLHPGMKCHFGVVVSPQTALLVKQFCTIASFKQPKCFSSDLEAEF